MGGVSYLQFIASLVFVLSLLGLFAYAVKRFGGVGPGMKPMNQRRLRVVEMLSLDPRKKLMLVRHDNEEHLILFGPNGDILLSTKPAHAINQESNLKAVPTDPPPAAQSGT